MTQSGPPAPVCHRHHDRQTGLACARCRRPACPDCLREAAVGYHCVDCVQAGNRDQRRVAQVPVAAVVRVPYVTYTLMALNIAIFAITAMLANSATDNNASQLFEDWVLYPPAVAEGQLIRLVGWAFLQYGPIHLLANMFALYVVGRFVEMALGPGRYLALYSTSMLGSAAAVMIFSQNAATAGASGAIFGLFGAQAVILKLLRQSPGPVLAVIFLNVVITLSVPGISIWGHFGGLFAGTLAGVGMLYLPIWLRRLNLNPAAVSWAAVATVGVGSMVAITSVALQLRTTLGL